MIVRSDEIRKRLFVLPTRLSPDAYTAAGNIRTNTEVIRIARTAAGSPHGVIIDATFLDPAIRQELTCAIRQAGIPFRGVWLQAPLPVLEARINARAGDASDATVAVLRQSARNDPGAGDWVAVDAADGRRALKAVRALTT